MENAEPNAAVPLSIRTLASTVNVEEQAQNQTNLNSVVQTSDLTQIEFRIQQLQGRHLLLQKTLSCTKKEEEKRGASGAEPTSEDGDQMCELETIQKELQELEALKENMVGNGVRFIATGRRGALFLTFSFVCFSLKPKSSIQTVLCLSPGPQVSNHVYRESPRGGIYTLPPPELQLEDTATQTREHQILPVESLGHKPATTKCPSCQAVIVTQTRFKVGLSSCLVCFVCSTLGCVAGCCLIPFFTNRFKNVLHSCPRCQTHIRTFTPV
uniref:LITAF domain-containing protein n=1 Tax=Oryzias latipes TaxID=8090 RepID=A0A3P9LVN2_ORYLA